MLLAIWVTNVSATDISVPANGTDTDLAAALEQASTGDKILISGYLTFSAPVAITKNVTIEGTTGNDGFDGNGVTQLFDINPEVIEGAQLLFKDLVFYNGNNTAGDGGAAIFNGGTTQFIRCYFEENQVTGPGGRGGAFYAQNAGTNISFDGCDFTSNKTGNRGGCAFITGDVNTAWNYCHIVGNKTGLDGESRGGGLWIEGAGTHRFFYSTIDGNSAGELDQGGERGGGAFVVNGPSAITFESSAIVNNIAFGNHGGAFFIMNTPNITFINSIVANNLTKTGAGGWFLATDNVNITFVNTIVADNKGDNAGNGGGGLRVMNLGNKINVFNSLIVRNLDNASAGIDFRFGGPNQIKNVVVKNSIIGLMSGYPDGEAVTLEDNAAIPTASLVNMYRLGSEDDQPNYADLDVSGIDFADGLQLSSDFKMPYYTLKSNTVTAAKLGDPALLLDRDLDVDMFLVKRATAADGSIFAGPVQSVTGEAVVNDAGWEDNLPTGIISPKAPLVQKDNIQIIGTVSNGILGVNYGNLKGQAKGELISLTGQVVENVFNINVVGKGYYNVNAAPGVYVLRVTIAGNVYSQKLIVQ
ncbi:hypothetical protein FACS189451_05870 [Bacteroidia bacterium]|nr:hypothetical protein FACS189451_05870 [Bacteroidia bacterium]